MVTLERCLAGGLRGKSPLRTDLLPSGNVSACRKRAGATGCGGTHVSPMTHRFSPVAKSRRADAAGAFLWLPVILPSRQRSPFVRLPGDSQGRSDHNPRETKADHAAAVSPQQRREGSNGQDRAGPNSWVSPTRLPATAPVPTAGGSSASATSLGALSAWASTLVSARDGIDGWSSVPRRGRPTAVISEPLRAARWYPPGFLSLCCARNCVRFVASRAACH
jgi:hypothetical protein